MPDRALFAAWQEAHEEASRAERDLNARFDAYAAGQGPEPELSLVIHARLLRAAATELLNKYIEAAARRRGGGVSALRLLTDCKPICEQPPRQPMRQLRRHRIGGEGQRLGETDRPDGARPVDDDDRLREEGPRRIGKDSCHGVRAAAGGPRDDHLDRAGRLAVGLGERAAAERGNEAEREGARVKQFHECFQ
jgi:hypothetical protein